MKYVKMLGLAAVAAAALMAFVGAGTASAAGILCSTSGSPCSSKYPNGTTLSFAIPSGGSANLQETAPPNGEGEVLDTCKESSVSGNVTNEGNAHGSISSLTWKSCTWTTTTTLNGGLEVESAGSGNGTVKSNSEIKVTISIPLFGSCVYGVTAGTKLGTITEGKPATFDANAVAKKLSGSSFTCPETSLWSATYTQTAPSNTTLYVATS
jgi:hypothetical protein